jgi:hypothetical protein
MAPMARRSSYSPTLVWSPRSTSRRRKQIIEDVNVARIYAGFHYRSTLVRSNTLGIAVANGVDDNMMTALAESSFSRDDKDDDGN